MNLTIHDDSNPIPNTALIGEKHWVRGSNRNYYLQRVATKEMGFNRFYTVGEVRMSPQNMLPHKWSCFVRAYSNVYLAGKPWIPVGEFDDLDEALAVTTASAALI